MDESSIIVLHAQLRSYDADSLIANLVWSHNKACDKYLIIKQLVT